MNTMDSQYLVASDGISHIYQQGDSYTVALQTATCSVKPGDRIALVGPSGSGKSTLLQLLGGLKEPSAGKIAWPLLGPPQNLRPRNISLIFQKANLLAPLTALENVEIPLLLLNKSPDEAREAAWEMMRRMDLGKLANQLPEELSGGQAQRVAAARSLVVRPRLLLADELTGQLDRITADHVMDVLLNVLENTDTALIVSTHDRKVAERMAIHWRMVKGRLECDHV